MKARYLFNYGRLAFRAKEGKHFFGKLKTLLQLNSVSLLCLFSIVQKEKLLIFIYHSFNHRAGPLHELFKIQGLIFLLFPKISGRPRSLALIVVCV